MFGDSITSGTNLPVGVDSRKCIQGNTDWPAQVAHAKGVAGTPDYLNESCPGASIDSLPGLLLADQARSAAENGAFGERTENVLIQLGFNDFWGNGLHALDAGTRCWADFIRGCDANAVAEGRAQDPAAMTGKAYADRIRKVVDYVRYYAPKAKIDLVGYPEMRAPQQNQVCIDIAGLPATNPRGAAYAGFLEGLQTAQRDGAKELGVGFVDVRAATAGHGPCTPDPWMSGLLDPRTNLLGVPFHMSPKGEAATATAVNGAIGV